MIAPHTKYVSNAGVNIAYQVIGEGAADLAWTPWLGGLEATLEHPSYVAFLEGLASFARVIRHDRRATGLSDRLESLPDLETQVEDLEVVLEAAGSKSTAMFGNGAGFGAAAMFAARHPERTLALVLYGAAARAATCPDYRWGQSDAQFQHWVREAELGWGTEANAAKILARDIPSMGQDYEFARWFAKVQRHWVTPGAAAALYRQWYETDVREILRTLRVPTLVLARENQDPDEVAYLLSLIPGAKYVSLPGRDSMPWVGDSDAILTEIQKFLGLRRMPPVSDTVLATVLFTDMAGSTQMAAKLGDRRWRDLITEHDAIVRNIVTRFRGHEEDHAGDGFLFSFDGPARAIRCACAISDALGQVDIAIRAAVHTGECEQVYGKLRGIAVHTGARLMQIAKPGDVLVSSTVRDLVAGSELTFTDLGTHRLKGVAGEWRVYSVLRT